ncbi:hypothetical protein BGX34_004538, partial [Mortierella sp. NVP85]
GRAKALRRQDKLEVDYREFGGAITSLGNLETAITGPLHRFGHTVSNFSNILRELVSDRSMETCYLTKDELDACYRKHVSLPFMTILQVYKSGCDSGCHGHIGAFNTIKTKDAARWYAVLKIQSGDKAVGNMFRTVNVKGQVKWVFIGHYREIRPEKETMALHDIVDSLGGAFDEAIGRVEMKLHLRVKEFDRLGEGKGDLGAQDQLITPSLLNRNEQYDPRLDIMQHPSIQSFTYTGSHDFVKRSSLVSCNDDLSNLRHLDLPLPSHSSSLQCGRRVLVCKNFGQDGRMKSTVNNRYLELATKASKSDDEKTAENRKEMLAFSKLSLNSGSILESARAVRKRVMNFIFSEELLREHFGEDIVSEPAAKEDILSFWSADSQFVTKVAQIAKRKIDRGFRTSLMKYHANGVNESLRRLFEELW